jgi:hypothetical protein
MSAQDIWATLGIERTNDQRAIRSAYAAKLKTIDVDGNPAAFVALREAFEWAQQDARYADYQDWDEDDLGGELDSSDLDTGDLDDSNATAPPPVDLVKAPTEPNEEITAEDAPPGPDSVAENPWAEPDGHEIYDAMSDLLYHAQERNRNLMEEEYNKLTALTDSFIRWLDNATIDEARDYEFALAHLMAATIPRSDVMLYKIPAYFGWENSAGNYDVPEQVEILLERRDANQALTRLMDPQHRLSAAFKALTSPTETSRKNGQLRMEARELIASARTHHPSLLAAFDYDRLAEWEKTLQIGDWRPGTEKAEAEKTSWVSYWWVGLILFALLRLCSAAVTPGSDYKTDKDLNSTTAQLELSNVVNEVFGEEISYSDLQTKNPAIAQAFEAQWLASYTGILFNYDAQKMIDRRAQAYLPKGTLDQWQNYWTLWADKAEFLKKQSTRDCATYVAGYPTFSTFPPEMQQRSQRLFRDLLLSLTPEEMDGGLSINDGRASPISVKIIGQVAAETSLPESAVRSAVLSNQGHEGARCIIGITLARIMAQRRSEEALSMMQRFPYYSFGYVAPPPVTRDLPTSPPQPPRDPAAAPR